MSQPHAQAAGRRAGGPRRDPRPPKEPHPSDSCDICTGGHRCCACLRADPEKYMQSVSHSRRGRPPTSLTCVCGGGCKLEDFA